MKKYLISLILVLFILIGGFISATPAQAQSFNIGLRGGIVLHEEDDQGDILSGDMPKVSLGFSSDMFTLDFTYQLTGIKDWDATEPQPFEHKFEADLGFSKDITDYFNITVKSKLDAIAYGESAEDADDRAVEYKYEIEAKPTFSMDIIADLWNVTGLTVMKFKPFDTGVGTLQAFEHDKTEFINTFSFDIVSVRAGFIYTGWYWMASIDDGYYGLTNNNLDNVGNMVIFPIGASANITLIEDMMSLSIAGDVSLVVAPDFEPIVNFGVDLPITVNDLLSFSFHAGTSLNLLSFGDEPVNEAVPAWRVLIRAELGITFPMDTGDSNEEEEAVENTTDTEE